MTYSGEDEVVPELRMTMGAEDDNIGDYVKLNHNLGDNEEIGPSSSRLRGLLWYWVKWGSLIVFLGVLVVVFLKWIEPVLMDKEVIPIINWETRHFSPPMLAVLVFASTALFPTLLLPSSPSMWVAGMTFGYGLGFLLIIAGVTVGVTIPYLIGSIFYHKIQGWVEKYPKRASIIRLAGEGNWFHQFRAVTLIRISPFPYILYNYCAVVTNVKYGPYVLGTLVGMVPEILVAIYTGILIRTVADASQDNHSLTAPQIVFNIIGFCATAATTVFFTAYAKKQLKKLQNEEEPLLE